MNLSLAQTSKAPYNVSATVNQMSANDPFDLNSLNITMPSCNSSWLGDQWDIGVLSWSSWWSVQGWKEFRLPRADVQFDGTTANLLMDAFWSGDVSFLKNISQYDQNENPDNLELEAQGSMKIRFSGHVDAYHSDILDVNSAKPRWLRTVGFNNNSQNIDYQSLSSAQRGKGPALMSVAMIMCLGFSAAMLLL